MKKLLIAMGAVLALGCLTAVVEACCGGPPPPTISVTVDPPILWPPNHKMADIALNVEVTNGDWFIVSVSSDEPDNAPGGGDGNTTGDIRIGDDGKSLALRAERCGNRALFDSGNNGRVYTIVIAAVGMGGQVFTVEQVTVPHNEPIEPNPTE